MKRYFSFLIFLVSFAFKANDTLNINKIDIYSLNFNLETRYNLREENVISTVESSEAYPTKFKTTIQDKKSLRRIFPSIKKLNSLSESKEGNYGLTDLRLVAIVEYLNGKKDTIAFSKTNYMIINGRFYNRDSDLLLKISNFLPKKMKGAIKENDLGMNKK
jgi:hypothetical protein